MSKAAPEPLLEDAQKESMNRELSPEEEAALGTPKGTGLEPWRKLVYGTGDFSCM